MRSRAVIALTVLSVAAMAVGSCTSAKHVAEPARAETPVQRAPGRTPGVKARPLEVDVQAKRFGSALRLDITGTGRGRLEGEPFEDAAQWGVEVLQNGASLQRAVNGPIKVAREPVGRATGSRWDVVVRFTVNFVMRDDHLPLTVTIKAPDEVPAKITIKTL